MNQAVDAWATLSALCRRSFGPSGDEVLLFAPPDAPMITGDGHAVLRAWQQAGQSNNAMERVILDSVEGVYKALGDGTTQFLIMLQSMMTQLHAIAGKDSTLSKNAMRIRLALELASIRRKWDRSLLTSELKLGHIIKTTIELDSQTRQPTGEFKVRLQQILLTALAGTLGEHVVSSVSQLVSAWVFEQPLQVDTTRAELYARVDRYLTQAVEVILHAQGSSFTQSQVLPDNEIILRKSLISTQPPGMLSETQARVAFVCFSCPLSSLAGSNHVVVESSTEVAASFSHTASLISGITSFFTTLREQLDVRLILSMERIDRDIVTTCTRLGIACVQHVEREELDTLCVKAGIYPLASVFDSVQVDRHIGLCDRVSTVRLEKTACLHLHGVCLKQGSSELLVPQLIIRAPSKGIYKQYYNAVLKSLRVLRSWFQSPTAENIEDVVVLSCRGAGAFELCVAKLLRSRSSQRTGAQTHEHYTVMEVIATSLGESIAQLRTNIVHVSGGDAAEGSIAKASQRFLLEDLSALSVSDSRTTLTGLIFDTRHTISIGAGSVLVPQVVVDDPLAYGVIHPWSRFETLLHVLFQTAEQLLRVDYILPVARCRPQGIEIRHSFEDDEDCE